MGFVLDLRLSGVHSKPSQQPQLSITLQKPHRRGRGHLQSPLKAAAVGAQAVLCSYWLPADVRSVNLTGSRCQAGVEQLELPQISKIQGELQLPGSKSLSNRNLLLAALASGTTSVVNILVIHCEWHESRESTRPVLLLFSGKRRDYLICNYITPWAVSMASCRTVESKPGAAMQSSSSTHLEATLHFLELLVKHQCRPQVDTGGHQPQGTQVLHIKHQTMSYTCCRTVRMCGTWQQRCSSWVWR